MLSRRTFLRQTTLAATAFAFTPGSTFHILKSKPKKGPIIGHGDFKYRVHAAWGTLDPSTHPVKDCHEMVIDKKGRIILLTNETRNNVLIYDRSGKLLDSWGNKFPGAHGLTLSVEGEEEFLFITDTAKREVYKTTLDGRILMTLTYPIESGHYTLKGTKYHPTETAIGPNGDIYIADGYGRQFVIQYDAKGSFIRTFGGTGWLWEEVWAGRYPDKIDFSNQREDPPGFLNNAHGITLDTRNSKTPCLLVTSRIDNAIKRFTLDGEYLSEIKIPGAFVNRAVIDDEMIYASVLRSDHPSRDRTGFVTILDLGGAVVSNPGGTKPRYRKGELKQVEQKQPVFVHPHDVCVDSDKNLYIPQWNADKVYPMMLERV